MKNTCSLCGGKLRDGVCTECGMDNRKSDELYKDALNQSNCQDMKLSHVHENGTAESYHSPTMNRTREREKEPEKEPRKGTYTPRQFPQSRKTGQKSIGLIVMIAFIVLCFVIAAVGNMQEAPHPENQEITWDEDLGDTDEGTQEEYTEDDYDPFQDVEEELNPAGELWEEEVSAGMYVVGVDIPEGEYILTGKDGSSYGVFDSAHFLSQNESFGVEEHQIEQAEGVKLFEGAIVCVDGFYPVKFYTENAQTQELTARVANPLTESYEVTGTAVAGEDFPEGTYDVYAQGDDFGVFAFELDLVREDHTIPFAFSTLMEQNPTEEYPEYCSVYKNVVLPAGTVLNSDTLKLQLVPSQGITTDDYAGFYDNAY